MKIVIENNSDTGGAVGWKDAGSIPDGVSAIFH
jgi:hypothetical protein